MLIIFFWKHSKFYLDSRNVEEKWEFFFRFGYNCIWIGCIKHSLLPRDNTSLGGKMLTKSLKISDTTKKELFKLIFIQSDQNIWQIYCSAGSSSVSDPSTCWLSITVLTRGFLGIWISSLFAVYNFRNKPALRLMFFL